MNNQVIHITAEEASPLATEYFMKICGFNREGEKIQRMMAEGLEVGESIRSKARIRAVASSFPSDAIVGNAIAANGVSFACNAFEQIDRRGVRRVYAYLLTAGGCAPEADDPIMRQLYADIWGTAFVDAGLEILKARLADGDAFECFGPGFYGMDIDQIENFFSLLDGAKIGMEVRNSSLMLPLKSCAGFLIAVDDKSKLQAADCAHCRAGRKGCQFCHAVIKQ